MNSNFDFLNATNPQLASLGALAERYFADDPNTALLKMRQFIELLARIIAAQVGLDTARESPLVDVLRVLKGQGFITPQVADLFHQIRVTGNLANHEIGGSHAEALAALKYARQIGIWYRRSYGRANDFEAGPFVPPRPPADQSAPLREEIARLQATVSEAHSEVERARAAAEQHALALLTSEQRAQREADERKTWEALAQQVDADLQRATRELASIPRLAQQEVDDAVDYAKDADEKIVLDEAATRTLIDHQLREAGWEADTVSIRFKKGTRPSKGKNIAIAEWPTSKGPADYALFVGTTLVATVEAKRKNKNVMSVLTQAERYSEKPGGDSWTPAEGGPWGDYLVPLAYATNGRPYLKQLETFSGIWHRDLRRPSNGARALSGWPTPRGVLDILAVDKDAAQTALKTSTFEFGFPLRAYQKRAIEKIDEVLATEQRSILVAMATGTGKTKLAIALLYRLISAKRFRRICFVVDRSTLGDQTAAEFNTTKVVGGKAFAEIFGLKGLGDTTPDDDTRVHICTIQGLVRRVLYSEEPGDAPPIDQYDLIVVDECHRGYLLDREMSDGELAFRDQADYVSKYRRVLDHFDAVKIGLTATPALHTTDIFGKPIYTYSYREAVIDGWLVDHEPPVRITTALTAAGIHFVRNESADFVHTASGEIKSTILADDLDFDVDQFNKSVITEAFNVAVAKELVNHIDLTNKAKTLVFAVSDAHADIVVKALRDAFREVDDELEDAAIQKLTGSVDHVRKKILSYRNDTLPQIAVTVDLLTTGIDVPRIANLVFLRRVNSRILYEQMMGRATRLCPEIGKETFRIFDAVDLYTKLQNLTDMKPVVTDVTETLDQLFRELAGSADTAWKEQVRDRLVVKLRRRLKKLTPEARAKFELAARETPEASLERLRTGDLAALSQWAKERPALGPILDFTVDGITPTFVPISDHHDHVIDVSHGYGEAAKPQDFLDGFKAFINGNINTIAALKIVVQRPQELTRAELKALRLALDAQGFSEASIRRAWADTTNQDIVASIIGHVRQAALGSPLVPFATRVDLAIARIIAKGGWTDVQKQWLHRIATQMKTSVVVDRLALDDEPFAKDGGFRIIDKRFGGRLSAVLDDLNTELWKDTA